LELNFRDLIVTTTFYRIFGQEKCYWIFASVEGTEPENKDG